MPGESIQKRYLPIVTRGGRGDTDEEGVEVELSQSRIGPPVDPLEMRSLGLGSLDVGLALGNGAHLGRELLGETHGVVVDRRGNEGTKAGLV
jgi:hypothetical protein